jgi:hypothetical protein
MASITIVSGKSAVYRSLDASGASPQTNILASTDGAMCVTKDVSGRNWLFRIYNAKVQYCLSTDAIGTSFGAWVDVVSSLVKDGVPTAECLENGRIEVCYWKTDSKWYRSFTDNFGTNWSSEEITA